MDTISTNLQLRGIHLGSRQVQWINNYDNTPFPECDLVILSNDMFCILAVAWLSFYKVYTTDFLPAR